MTFIKLGIKSSEIISFEGSVMTKLSHSILVSIIFFPAILFSEIEFSEPGIGYAPKYEKIAEDHYSVGMQAMNSKEWKKAANAFYSISNKFPNSKYGAVSKYFCGVALYKAKEYELANNAFNNYLKDESTPQFFEESLKYKFSIAEMFRSGEKRRPFGRIQALKFLPAYQIALSIYDEISTSIPCHDLAALSIYYKGCLLWKIKEYREAVESFQLFTKRFPKHELTPEAYLYINKVYFDLSCKEFQNPDIITLAELNVKNFKIEFPKDSRSDDAFNEVNKIKEVYAKGLYEIGQFYERTFKSKASLIYYENAILQYPDTDIAKKCRERLQVISPQLLVGIEKILRAEAECSKMEDIEEYNFENIDFYE